MFYLTITILRKVSSTFENLRTSSETSEKALAEAQQKFLAVSTGKEDASESLQDQLMGEFCCYDRLVEIYLTSLVVS